MHIQPEWYFLFVCVILRFIPNKLEDVNCRSILFFIHLLLYYCVLLTYTVLIFERNFV